MNERVQVILSKRLLKESVSRYLDTLEEAGVEIEHLIGFTVYVLGEPRDSIPLRPHEPRLNEHSYLAHELLSVNPMLAHRSDFSKIIGVVGSAIELLMYVIRGSLFQATRNLTAHRLLLEKIYGDAVIVSANIVEDTHGFLPRFTAPVFG